MYLYLATLYSAVWCWFAFSSTFSGVALSLSLQAFGWVTSILCLYFARPRLRCEASLDLAVLISGCDTGFGNLLAHDLSEQGFRVFAGCLTPAGVESFRGLAGVDAFMLDLRSGVSIAEAGARVRAWVAAGGLREDGLPQRGLHALVNNAGIGSSGVVDWTTMASFRDTMEVNFFGHVAITKELLPQLLRDATLCVAPRAAR
jgi:11-cis-retinol dehydrogenase